MRQGWEEVKASLLWKVVAGLTALIAVYYSPVMDYIEGRWGGEIALRLHTEVLRQGAPTFIFYSIPENSADAKFLLPVELSVFNDAEKSDSNVSLSMEFNKASERLVIPEDAMRHSGVRTARDITHEVNSSDHYDYSNYRIAFMPAGDSLSFTDAAFASPVNLSTDFPVLFSTGAGLDIKVFTYSENDIKREWDIRYRGVAVDSDEGIERWVRNWYGTYIALEIRESVGFWRYLYGLLISEDVVVYGFTPSFRHLDGKNIYLPTKNPDKYTVFKFNPYVWSLLFDFE